MNPGSAGFQLESAQRPATTPGAVAPPTAANSRPARRYPRRRREQTMDGSDQADQREETTKTRWTMHSGQGYEDSFPAPHAQIERTAHQGQAADKSQQEQGTRGGQRRRELRCGASAPTVEESPSVFKAMADAPSATGRHGRQADGWREAGSGRLLARSTSSSCGRSIARRAWPVLAGQQARQARRMASGPRAWKLQS